METDSLEKKGCLTRKVEQVGGVEGGVKGRIEEVASFTYEFDLPLFKTGTAIAPSGTIFYGTRDSSKTENSISFITKAGKRRKKNKPIIHFLCSNSFWVIVVLAVKKLLMKMAQSSVLWCWSKER